MPAFSIIVPAYNCERFIDKTLASVVGQFEGDFEAIVIDDGSSDNTLNIAKSFAQEDDRIRVISQKNSGKPAIPRNLGIRYARGEYICFLDGDDLYALDRLKIVKDLFDRHPELDVIFHDFKIIDESGEPNAKTFLQDLNYLAAAQRHLEYVSQNFWRCRQSFYGFMSTEIAGIHTTSIIIRRDFLTRLEYKFSEDLMLMEDFDLWFRVVLSGQTGFLNEPLSFYRRYTGSISSKQKQFALDQLEAHSRNFARGKNRLTWRQGLRYRIKIAKMNADLGYANFRDENIRDARSAYRISISWFPVPWVIVAYAKSFLPAKLFSLARNILGRN